MAGTKFQFGSGSLWGVPVGGNLSSGALAGDGTTPRKFGTLQGCAVDFNVTQKELIGQNLFPDDVAVASIKIAGKATIGQVDLNLFNDLLFGQSMTSGYNDVAINVAGTVPGTPYQITPTVPSSGTWQADLGVYDVTASKFLTQVTSSPATGQYSVSAGVYTFAAADTTHSVQISFQYSVTAVGEDLAVSNQLQGYSPIFQVVLNQKYENVDLTLVLYQCKSAKLTLPTKAAEYSIPEFDFAAYQNAAGKVFDWYGTTV